MPLSTKVSFCQDKPSVTQLRLNSNFLANRGGPEPPDPPASSPHAAVSGTGLGVEPRAPCSREHSVTASAATVLPTRTRGRLADAAEEEGPWLQGAGAVILLLHTELAELGHCHLLRSRKVSAAGRLCRQGERRGEGCGGDRCRLPGTEPPPHLCLEGCETSQNSGHRVSPGT